MGKSKLSHVCQLVFGMYGKQRVAEAAIIIALVALVCRTEVPHDLQSEYIFDGGFEFQGEIVRSTEAIFFPDCARREGSFRLINSTGYNICVATQQYGFCVLEQGEYSLDAKPLVFFVIRPESGKEKEYSGEFIIREENGRNIIYAIDGNDCGVADISCSIL